MSNNASQGHHRLYRRSGCSLTAETRVFVEALLAEFLVTVLIFTSQGLTMFLSLVVYKAGMVYSSKTTTIRAAV